MVERKAGQVRRGFFSGLIWGVVLAGGTAVVVSLLAPLPPSPDVAATAPDRVAVAPAGGGMGAQPDGRDGDLVELPPTAPGGAAPDDLNALESSDTRPAALPAVGGASGALSHPGAVGQAPELTGNADAPVTAAPPAPVVAASGGGAKAPSGPQTQPAALPRVGAATGGLQTPGAIGGTPEVDAKADAPVAEAPQAAAPAAPSGGAGAPGEPQTRPAALPRVGAATGGLQTPGAVGGAPEIGAKADAPVGSVSAAAPVSPTGETEPSISTDPAQPEAPAVEEAESGFGAKPPEVGTTPQVSDAQDAGPLIPVEVAEAPRPATEAPPNATGDAAAALPASVREPSQPRIVVQSGTEPPVTTTEQPVQAPQVVSVAPEQPGAAPTQPATPVPDTNSPPPRLAALPQAGQGDAGDGPAIGTRVVPLTERNKTPVLTLSGDSSGEEAAPGIPPLKRYAADFDNPQGKPLMAIVLIDDEKSLGYEALADFPYPLSFAIDPTDPRASEKMARYRAAGFEVVLLADLPAAASARDAEVMLAAGFDVLPESVAILEGVGSGIQGNRALAMQVSDIARATGRGLITRNNGLNTVEKLAARSGVPAAIVFRDFDGAGQTPTIMRRFLDQAAFRAGQEGAVIMLGRVRPDTISALLLWGLQDRASRVALAPVSAVLTRPRK